MIALITLTILFLLTLIDWNNPNDQDMEVQIWTLQERENNKRYDR